MRELYIQNYEIIFALITKVIWIIFIIEMILLIFYVILALFKKSFRTIEIRMAVTTLLDKYLSGIIAYAKKIPLLLLALIIIRVLFDDIVFNIIFDYVNKYKDIFLIILGAFISGLITMIRNSIVEKRKNRSKLNSEALMIYYDLKTINREMESNKISYKGNKIDFDGEWENKYSNICSELTYDHYRCIRNAYNIIDTYNEAIQFIGNDKAKSKIREFNRLYKDYWNKPQLTLSLDEVLIDLERISKHKKRKEFAYNRIIDNLLYLRLIKKHFNTIENKLIEQIKSNASNDSKAIDIAVKVELTKEKNMKRYIASEQLDKLIFDISMNSLKIDRIWGSYYIKEEIDKAD